MRAQLFSTYLPLYAASVASASSLWTRTGSSNVTSPNAKPVLAVDFPDPALVESGGAWYAFATSGNGKNVQAAVSGDFLNPAWRLLQDADVLPDPGAWAVNDQNVWAPGVIQLDDSRWVMYYAAPSKSNSGSHCIGVGTATNILGPYEPVNEPIACPLTQGGAIDPFAFKDPRSGNLYIVYKVDGNNLNTGGGPCKGAGDASLFHPTPIMLQQVDPADGTTLIGEPFEILDRSAQDGPLVEAPSLFYQPSQGLYYLTYSSGCYSSDTYDVRFAYSTDLHATFNKSPTPIMSSGTGSVNAPGSAHMTSNGSFAVFHGTVGQDGNGEPIRHMFAAESQQAGGDMSAWII